MRNRFLAPIVSFALFITWTAVGSLLADSGNINSCSTKPNIVVILADDLGYGDVRANNPSSKIPTPAFDRLATEGVNFTDAHSGSGVCTPTRYGLVCGQYCWRTRLKRGVLGGYSAPLIDTEQQTIASVLSDSGYRTACIGKWHLGLGWNWQKPKPGNLNSFSIAGEKGSVDYSSPISDGPTHHGFDESYIIPASLDMSPYIYVKDDRATQIPGNLIDAESFPKYYRKGEIASEFSHLDCLSHLLGKAQDFVRRESKTDSPFFLYFPMPAPHKPVMPMKEFQGKTELGPYGDFVHQVDWTIGQLLKTLDETNTADNTLVIVTSDNGSFMYRYDDPDTKDHLDDDSVQGYRPSNHTANGPLRGTKADVYEGGHRVPFFVRWPNQIKKANKVNKTICLTDILSSAASAAGASFDNVASPDSFSFLHHAFVDQTEPQNTRPHVINHSASGMFAIRDGKWKLILGNGSGGRQAPKGKPFEQPYQLFDLESDLGESTNVIKQHPDIETKLVSAFEKIANGDQFVPKSKKQTKKKQSNPAGRK